MSKILIADDEPHMRLLLEQTLEDLEDEGATILFADNGKAALDIIRKERPNIVFLDVMMPEVNGFDVCNTVKNIDLLKDIYIILLTAKGQETDKKKGAEVCADMYMTKPFNPDAVFDKAREILKMNK